MRKRRLGGVFALALGAAVAGCAPAGAPAGDAEPVPVQTEPGPAVDGAETMESKFEKIERLRAEWASTLLALEGVASVTVGVGPGGRPRLRIGTRVPVEEVRPRLPEELAEVEVELVYQGQLGPQAMPTEMSPEYQEIERLRAEVEAELLAIDGVVMVATGLGADGKPCLKVGTSVPVDQVRPKLPQGLKVPVEVEFLGDVRIQ